MPEELTLEAFLEWLREHEGHLSIDRRPRVGMVMRLYVSPSRVVESAFEKASFPVLRVLAAMVAKLNQDPN